MSCSQRARWTRYPSCDALDNGSIDLPASCLTCSYLRHLHIRVVSFLFFSLLFPSC